MPSRTQWGRGSDRAWPRERDLPALRAALQRITAEQVHAGARLLGLRRTGEVCGDRPDSRIRRTHRGDRRERLFAASTLCWPRSRSRERWPIAACPEGVREGASRSGQGGVHGPEHSHQPAHPMIREVVELLQRATRRGGEARSGERRPVRPSRLRARARLPGGRVATAALPRGRTQSRLGQRLGLERGRGEGRHRDSPVQAGFPCRGRSGDGRSRRLDAPTAARRCRRSPPRRRGRGAYGRPHRSADGGRAPATASDDRRGPADRRRIDGAASVAREPCREKVGGPALGRAAQVELEARRPVYQPGAIVRPPPHQAAAGSGRAGRRGGAQGSAWTNEAGWTWARESA